MRKNYLLFFGVLFCSLSSFSQHTLVRQNYFTLGNQYTLYRITAMNVNTVQISGNNAIWNFSDAELTEPDTVTALEPSATVFYSDPNVNYNTTQLCLNSTNQLQQIENNMFSYFHSSNNEISFGGEWADNATWEFYFHHFDDPEQYFAFPFTYGDSFTDAYLSTGYDMSGSGFHKQWGERTVVADGTGTLMMPDKTYTDCLRLKATIHYSDSNGVWGVSDYTRYQYTWFDLKTNGPVLDVELGSNFWLLNADYYFNNPPVASKTLPFERDITLSPNPAGENLYVQFTHPPSGNIDFVVYTLTGNAVKTYSKGNSAVYELNVRELSAGIYFLGIITSEGAAVRKFVKL